MSQDHIRRQISPYISKYGVITLDMGHKDGNDAPHKTGFYYTALGIQGDVRQEDLDGMIKIFENLVDRSGNLLRYPTTKFGKDRYFWQMSSRDQYLAIFGGLAFMRGKNSTVDMWMDRLWEIMNWEKVAGRNLIILNHYNFFSRCMGEEHKIKRVWFWAGEFAELINYFIQDFNQLMTYIPWIKKFFPTRLPGRGMNSSRILLIQRLRATLELRPSWLTKLTWWLMRTIHNPWYEVERYFKHTWDGTVPAPVHLAWEPILK